MKIKDKDISPTRKNISICFSTEEVVSEEANVIKEFIKHVKIPGFRKGKANEKMIRLKYAKDVSRELEQKLLDKGYNAFIKDSSDNVYGVIDMQCSIDSKSRSSQVDIIMDYVPAFDLPNYNGIKIKSLPNEVKEEEIDQMINHILGQRAEFKPVDKVITKGDYVKCSYEGLLGEESIQSIVPQEKLYGTQKSTWEEAGAENTPGVSAVVNGLIGMKKDELKDVEMIFPEDFKVKELQGKKALYKISVEEVREKILPKMDGEFYKSMQVKDENEFRLQIRKTIESRKLNEIESSNRQQIIDHLTDFVKVPLPESGLESEKGNILKDFMKRNVQAGVSNDEVEKNMNVLDETASKMAESRLKSFIILDLIAKKESIKVENNDLSSAIVQQASIQGLKPELYVKQLRKDRNQIELLKRDVKIGKTLNLLLSKAQIEVDSNSDEKKAEKSSAKN